MTTLVRTVAELRRALEPTRRAGGRIGFVPTMGALHDGHLRLVTEAAAASDVVVVSVFVNPTQFTDAGDLRAYPRTLESDVALAASAGADLVFAPDADEVYPAGFATTVHVAGVTERWEGEARGPAHFDGMATVVAKLFAMVGADAAWFGQKDAQQVAVVRRMVADLDLPIAIHAVPTVRAPDGLALSSRNIRLSEDARSRALAIPRSLVGAGDAVAAGETSAAAVVASAHALLAGHGIEPEYWAVVDPTTFEPVTVVEAGSLAIVAGVVDGVRLIDNLTLREA